MTRHPIRPGIAPGGDDDTTPGVDAATFRRVLGGWAATVTIVAVRDGTDVHATTVTSFFPVSATPPVVAVSLGPNAQPLPWLDPGARFAVSFLSEGQRRIASDYADSLPTGPSPFPPEGDPVVEGAAAFLACTVLEVYVAGGGARLVVARVESAAQDGDRRPLLYHRRGYRRLATDE